MTMAEIDRRREIANQSLDDLRRARDYARLTVWPNSAGLASAEANLEQARGNVEAALREWWEQDCKEEHNDHR